MKTFKKEIVTIMNNVWIVTCHFSIWFATSLSLFYFLKIASFSNSVFLYLKWRVEKVVSVTLLLSLLLLLCNIVQANIEIGIRIKLHKRNMTLDHISMESAHLFTILMSVESLFMVIPFTVSLTAFLLLIFSLWKHLRKMQLNARESRDASTKAHLKGLQTVIASNVLWIIFFLSILVLTWSPELQEKHLIIMVFYVFAMSYPSGHSCILILGNRKLKLASISVLWWLKSWFKKCFLRYIRS
ncbi:taste receptor type 2 member 140-like [Ochotona princeps]|uniref:taste receptor type 2 member 140-like n=1 Tax=Ochotona princeps TaxID=9978 RepID=UPI002714C19C|nr:taste receptor type 2 member 140-like [Ochotona princeps]